VLFETIIVVPETAGEQRCCVRPSPCHLRQRNQQRDCNDEQHSFGLRHRPRGAALELVNDYTAIAAVAEGPSSFAATSRKRRRGAG